jgi:hypothetical protein
MSMARASVWVREGTVSQTQFELDVDVPPFRDAEGRTESYPLVARLYTIPRREPLDQSEIEYAGPDACTGCVAVWVKYTPYATPEDIDRVGRINFACITGWRKCRAKDDIMPGAMFYQRPQPPDSDAP